MFVLSSHLASHDSAQAAFVESMILLFAGGKTGLSAAVTGTYIGCLSPSAPVSSPGTHNKEAVCSVVTKLDNQRHETLPDAISKGGMLRYYWGLVGALEGISVKTLTTHSADELISDGLSP